MKLAGALLGAIIATLATLGVAAAQEAADGSEVYETSCAGCHQTDGSGLPGSIPPLAGNPSAADTDYVASVIGGGLRGPIQVLGQTYDTPMSPIPLDDAETAAVVAYVQALATGVVSPSTTASSPLPVGDADQGRRIFEGSFRLKSGEAACRACHSAGSIGFRGGSGLGPDLTDAFDRLGRETGLAAWLANPPSPTMRPLYGDDELTESEIADLVAFFAAVRSEEASGGFDQLLVAGLGGFAVLLVLMGLALRGPQPTYTQRLRRRR